MQPIEQPASITDELGPKAGQLAQAGQARAGGRGHRRRAANHELGDGTRIQPIGPGALALGRPELRNLVGIEHHNAMAAFRKKLEQVRC